VERLLARWNQHLVTGASAQQANPAPIPLTLLATQISDSVFFCQKQMLWFPLARRVNPILFSEFTSSLVYRHAAAKSSHPSASHPM
jgi:hypothetical protein